ncbi:MAG: Cobalamin import system permease protein BtuC [Methanosaeta sp. PtaU1.Bin060]|jgi:iron complex transport system permease protein|nr:MAG: Cobalamin import system permease protein BtuC [Methanosaeta sp. PtaU1.Bin060]
MSTFKRTDLREEYQRFLNKKLLFFLVLIIGTIFLACISVSQGSAGLSIKEVCMAILARFLPDYFTSTRFADNIVWSLRLNRILMGIVAGMGLSIAGATMQGILKNPLASEFTLGMDSAACLGASLAIVLGAGFAGGEYLIIGNAFVFTLIASFTVYGLARYKGITPETLILAGIAITYLFSAMTTFLQYMGRVEELHDVVFWMMGSLDGATWERIGLITAILVLCLPYLVIKSWDINAIGAGDETAKSLGVDVERTRVTSMMLASLITASIICFTGTIGFVGLVGPHITRMVIGGDHRFLLPGSALTGAAILLGADTLARTVLAPVILPVGVMTSFLGVPFFIYLFMRRRRAFW